MRLKILQLFLSHVLEMHLTFKHEMIWCPKLYSEYSGAETEQVGVYVLR